MMKGREGSQVQVVHIAAALTDPLLGSGELLRCGRTTRSGFVLQICKNSQKYAEDKFANSSSEISNFAIKEESRTGQQSKRCCGL